MATTAQLNQAGYADTPDGRAQYAAGQPPTGAGKATALQQNNSNQNLTATPGTYTQRGSGVDVGNLPMIAQGSNSGGDPYARIGGALDELSQALGKGDTAKFQELVREFNLNYANSVAQLYGSNYGPGNPAPIGASTLALGQATGAVGYTPGFSGINTGQTQSNIAQQQSSAQNAAGLTGFYAAPRQSQYTPGTFLKIDPSTYDYATHGDQYDYVTASGQLQRVSIPQMQAMSPGGAQIAGTIPFSTAAQLESAPPTQLPQQTLEGLTTYSNLNTAAQNNAIAQSGVTGMYSAPGQVVPPGTNMQGGKFQDLDQQTQNAYYYSNGGDWLAAMNKWVADANKSIQDYNVQHGLDPNAGSIYGNGQPQETLAAQNQYFNQANQLAQTFGSYYAPGAPGQAAQAGVNAPQVGQQTLAANEQYYRQQLDAINAAAAMQANPFRQQQVIGQVGQLLGGQGVAQFQAPNTNVQNGTQAGSPTAAQNPNGGAFSGLNNMQAMIDDIRGGPGSVNSVSAQQTLDAIPTPNKLNSTEFFRMTPQGQNLILSGMQQKYGIEPTDSLAQIKNTLPAFTAPTTFGTVRR